MSIATDALSYATKDGIDYDFAIQTGDAIEISNIYSYWDDILKVFADEALAGTDMIHVFGNHEHMGDASGISSKLLFDIDKDYYSLTYGNVYVAVINYSATQSEAGMKATAQWLVEDANASDAMWKVVTIHTPAYNTNAQAPTPVVQKYLPAACDAAAIDAVFSGHDHSFARTAPLVGGEVTDGGTVYYICGNMGEKSYNTTDNPDYHFAEILTEYKAAYLSVTATDIEMLINLYDVPTADSGMLIDTYTIKKTTDCNTNGHVNKFDGEIYAFDEEGKFAHYGEHVDADSDGECDECPKKSVLTGFLSWLIEFFQKIAEFFKSIFS